MRRSVVPLSLCAGLLFAAAGSATVCNIDLTNRGTQPAYDVEIELSGTQSITDHYNGTSGVDDVFALFGVAFSGGNTFLHWTNPGSPIPPVPAGHAPQAHVGFTTANNNCPIIDFFWTDASGNRIPGSVIGVLEDHLTHTTITITNGLSSTVTVGPVRWGCSTTTFPLSGLNRTNSALQSILTTISSSVVTLGPNQSVHIPFPTPPCLECTCYTNYKISGSSLSAESSPWYEDPAP